MTSFPSETSRTTLRPGLLWRYVPVYSPNPVLVDTEGIDDIGAGSLNDAILFNNFRRRLPVANGIDSSLQVKVVSRVSAMSGWQSWLMLNGTHIHCALLTPRHSLGARLGGDCPRSLVGLTLIVKGIWRRSLPKEEIRADRVADRVAKVSGEITPDSHSPTKKVSRALTLTTITQRPPCD